VTFSWLFCCLLLDALVTFRGLVLFTRSFVFTLLRFVPVAFIVTVYRLVSASVVHVGIRSLRLVTFFAFVGFPFPTRVGFIRLFGCCVYGCYAVGYG